MIAVRAVMWMWVAAFAACGADAANPPQPSPCQGTFDTYAAGLRKSTEGGHFAVVMLSSMLVPPDRGDNGFTFQVQDSAGAPVLDASLVVRPWMPNHGHGSTPDSFVPTAGANPGEYQVGPINFFMPGLWQLRVDVTSPGVQASERATFGFCVEG